MLCEQCERLQNRAMRALEHLTPGGSEFVDDVEECVKWIRANRNAQHAFLCKQAVKINELNQQVKQLQDALAALRGENESSRTR